MLTPYLRRRVSVITVDGRYLIGVLHSADQLLNIVLTSCVERFFDAHQNGALEETPSGVLMLRGADVVCVAALDTLEEAKVRVKEWKGQNVPPVQRVPRAASAAV